MNRKEDVKEEVKQIMESNGFQITREEEGFKVRSRDTYFDIYRFIHPVLRLHGTIEFEYDLVTQSVQRLRTIVYTNCIYGRYHCHWEFRADPSSPPETHEWFNIATTRSNGRETAATIVELIYASFHTCFSLELQRPNGASVEFMVYQGKRLDWRNSGSATGKPVMPEEEEGSFTDESALSMWRSYLQGDITYKLLVEYFIETRPEFAQFA